MFGALYAAEGTAADALVAVAQEFTPRLEVCGEREVVLDLSGVSRLFGESREIAHELRREAADRGLQVRVALAGTRTAARLAVHDRAGVTIIEPGTEAAALDLLPVGVLTALVPDVDLMTLRRWGLTTLGELAALDARELAARLGQRGVAWQRLARGEDPRPLLAAVPEERFEQALDLEWPIEGLEPLSFVLGRLMDPLSAHLERRDRGAAVLHVRLQLVSKREDGSRDVHERSLELPTPIRDARTLRTLALLDLESHPPAAAIDRVTVAVDPTPGRIVQYSLLTRPLPSPEQVSTLVARLDALMGQGRSGSPAPVDSWQPGAFTVRPFLPSDTGDSRRHEPQSHGDTENSNDFLCASVPLCAVEAKDAAPPALALRRFRIPVPARVRVDHGRPVRVMTDRAGLAGGGVTTCAGPWRTSGGWWSETKGAWNRDEWDVTLSDGGTYRVFRERDADNWFIEGVVD
jgi:nucleotidyltransferase/DNA polymerase involved in DNA repair